MNEYLSLNEINSISKETHLSTKLDIELLVLDLLNIDKNILYRDNPSLSSKQLKKLTSQKVTSTSM